MIMPNQLNPLHAETERLRNLLAANPHEALLELDAHDLRAEIIADLLNQSRRVDRYVIASTTDAKGTITNVSQAFCDISGYAKSELIGRNHNIVRHPDIPASLYRELWETIRSGQSWHGQIKNRKKNGDHYWVDVYIDPIFDAQGQISGYAAISQDTTEKKRIERMTITDELTGCYNRRHFNRLFPEEIRRAKRDRHFLALLMVDADNFKKYNDTYGHQAGDEVLQTIARVLHTTFSRASDHVFRLGGEEFAVICQVNAPEHAQLVAQRAIDAMFAEHIEHSGNPPHHRVTLSMGVMVIDPAQEYVYEELYKYADEALYRAKSNGRNRVEITGINSNNDIELF